jgi:hypothetical protein
MIPLQDCKFHKMLAPISINGAAATTLAVDAIGAGHLTVIIMLGVVGADADAVKLQESNDDSSYVDVAGAASTVVTGNAGTIIVWSIPLRGTRRRYFKPVIDPGAAATLVSALAITHQHPNAPTSATEAGLSHWVKLAG